MTWKQAAQSALAAARPGLAAAALGAVAAAALEAVPRASMPELALTTAGYAALGLWPSCALVLWAGAFAAARWRAAQAAPAAAQGVSQDVSPSGPQGELPQGVAPHILDGAHRGAGLVAFVVVASASIGALVWTAGVVVRWAALRTAFLPATLALLVPGAIGLVALALAVLGWPVFDVLRERLRARALRRYQRHGRPPWSVRRWSLILAGAGVGALAAVAAATTPLWTAIDPSGLRPAAAPALALLVTVIGYRARLPRLLGWLALAAAPALLACAAVARLWQPSLVLDAWAEATFAAEAIEQLHSLPALRSSVLPASATPRPRPGAAHPDVVLITLDTVRADRTPLGGGPAAMPALAALGDRGAVMTRAIAPGNVTRRSLPSLVTGLSPTRVRGKTFGWALRIDPRHVVLAERFAAAGYQTAGFFCCESFWGRDLHLGLDRGLAELTIDRNGDELARKTAEYLRARRLQRSPRPLFLWLHLFDPHHWNGGGAFIPGPEQARARYDQALAVADRQLAQVLAELSPQALVAVTADHGEGLGEHGASFHGTNLSQSQIHVPLVIAGPDVVAARHAEATGLIDLAPTLLELAGFEVPTELEGRSLAELLRGQRPSGEGYAFAAMIRDRSVAEERVALIRGRWKLVRGPNGFELYDLEADPGEQRNLAGSAPELAILRQLLRDRQRLDERSPFSPLSR